MRWLDTWNGGGVESDDLVDGAGVVGFGAQQRTVADIWRMLYR